MADIQNMRARQASLASPVRGRPRSNHAFRNACEAALAHLGYAGPPLTGGQLSTSCEIEADDVT